MRAGSALAMALALMGCSSGGSSSGSGGTSGTAPAPTPTPTPTTALRAFGAAREAASFYFYTDGGRTQNANTAFGYGTRDGIYRAAFNGHFQTGSFGPAPVANLSVYPADALGVDQASSIFQRYKAPANARAITPLTTLIVAAGGDQAAVRQAFRLHAGGTYALAASTDLLQFDAIDAIESSDTQLQAEGARVLASNLRVEAVTAAVMHFPIPVAQFGNVFLHDYDRLGAFIAAHPATSLFDNATTSALLESLVTPGQFRPDVISGAAHLIDAYCATIGVHVTSTAQAARFKLGLEGYLVPALQKLLTENSAAAASAALAVTNNDIMIATERYLETVPFNATGFVFPGPDFLTLAPGATVTLPADGNDLMFHYAPISNDVSATASGLFGRDQQMVSVTVPAANASQVTAVLHGDGTITVGVAAGFTGVTYFDYRIRNTAIGEEAVGRVYLRVA